MPYGIHEGKKMANVPAGYLLHLYEYDKCDKQVKDYIIDNLDVLEIEVKREEMNRKYDS